MSEIVKRFYDVWSRYFTSYDRKDLENGLGQLEEEIQADERRKLLAWLMYKDYLCSVYTDEDEDFDGNRTYETVTQYLDVDEVLKEYEEEQKNE